MKQRQGEGGGEWEGRDWTQKWGRGYRESQGLASQHLQQWDIMMAEGTTTGGGEGRGERSGQGGSGQRGGRGNPESKGLASQDLQQSDIMMPGGTTPGNNTWRAGRGIGRGMTSGKGGGMGGGAGRGTGGGMRGRAGRGMGAGMGARMGRGTTGIIGGMILGRAGKGRIAGLGSESAMRARERYRLWPDGTTETHRQSVISSCVALAGGEVPDLPPIFYSLPPALLRLRHAAAIETKFGRTTGLPTSSV
ncbi:hypothetical protein CBR_g6421 [Chara braunii]|uniref:Uncharacterized protein n=1 Tax=Chara braunii TaxID=69332 RepID=A0A388KJR3_CHABU|nr:hypothetical protein CBR_g6421 [Chara braunii]|eukprot:GBG70294.1 hypothetical protein CBR_g6421 [Chara braunii]